MKRSPAEIIARVRFRFNIQNLANPSDADLAAELQYVVNDYYGLFSENGPPRRFSSEYTLTVAQNVPRYDLAILIQDYRELQTVYYQQDPSTGQVRKLTYMPEAFRGRVQNPQEGCTLTLVYTPTAPRIDPNNLAASIIEAIDGMDDYIIEGMGVMLATREGRPERGQAHRMAQSLAAERIRKYIKQMTKEGIRRIRDTEEEDTGDPFYAGWTVQYYRLIGSNIDIFSSRVWPGYA